jgi:hypothetical protein
VEQLQTQYKVPYAIKEQLKDHFRPSIGVSIDPDGNAKANKSMVYLWTPNSKSSVLPSFDDLLKKDYGRHVLIPFNEPMVN